MAFYDRSNKQHHWFPRVNHMTEYDVDYDRTPDTMLVEDAHQLPYIGDFPPKDDYSEHRFY
jgi:hypothetical protein